MGARTQQNRDRTDNCPQSPGNYRRRQRIYFPTYSPDCHCRNAGTCNTCHKIEVGPLNIVLGFQTNFADCLEKEKKKKRFETSKSKLTLYARPFFFFFFGVCVCVCGGGGGGHYLSIN